ncbi:MAG: hypothetical protein A7315_06850 [Candidatus Altiarchaeales archaeon WOR_SM1_79]|nr:MAG: hypothetical protein A7315_06850 [Candidatus Altiarchaeales archaeon WOR_SM1_79]
MKITNKTNEIMNLNLIKILTIFGILGIILVSGCVKPIDKSCNSDSDCHLSCVNSFNEYGCTNNDVADNLRMCDPPRPAGECKCINGKCEFFEEKPAEQFYISYHFTAERIYEKIEINQLTLTYTYFEDVDEKCRGWAEQTPCWTEKDLKVKEDTLSEDEIDSLINSINRINFVNLENTYYRYVEGGRCYGEELSVKINEKEKNVVYYTCTSGGIYPKPEAFKEVKDKLFEIVNEKFNTEKYNEEKPEQITEQEAIAIANATREVRAFLMLYPDAEINVLNYYYEGFGVKNDTPKVFYVGVLWNGSTPIEIAISKKTGVILAKYSILEYIKNPVYCENDSDCIGTVLNMGAGFCTNFIHPHTKSIGIVNWCKCINKTCKAIESKKSSTANDTQATNVITANNKFAFDLYSEFKDGEGNIFFSPYSISTALVMTYEGARGKTAEEMQSVLHFPENDNTRRTGFEELRNQINKEDKKYELRTANALWAQKDYKFLENYFNTIGQYYGGKVTNLDFIRDTENSRITINNWVENQTNNKIKNLIPKGVLNGDTRLVLTNAIYFKGTWLNPFDKERTTDADFKVSSDKTVKVQMMRLKREEKIIRFNYTETEKLQIIELPYEGDDLSVLIILPNDNLESLENSLNAEKLNEWRNNLTEEWVDVHIPRFKFETKYFMNENLKEMGMATAFSGDADFSGMTGKKDLFISNVIHQAFVEVNEEGTEAAAATAAAMDYGMPTTFRADHPFIFIILHKETGNILFMGRVVDPTQK